MTSKKTPDLMFESTRVPAENSIAAIEKLLLRVKAERIDKAFENGRCVAIRAVLVVGEARVPITLAARTDAIVAHMRRAHKALTDAALNACPRRPRPAAFDVEKARAQAERVAWRVLRSKLEGDIGMLQIGAYESALEALFQHVTDREGVTVYQRLKQLGPGRFLGLPAPTEPKEPKP